MKQCKCGSNSFYNSSAKDIKMCQMCQMCGTVYKGDEEIEKKDTGGKTVHIPNITVNGK